MKKIIIGVFLGAIMLAASSYQIILKTSLEIKILNRLGSTVSGVEVKLYQNKEDYQAGKNPVGEAQKTDDKGKVLFKELKPQAYYVSAVKGELSNYGDAELTDTLTAGRRNKVVIIIN
jgi:hypothetical protein